MNKKTTTIMTIAASLLSLVWIFGLFWSIHDFYYGNGEVTRNEPAKKETNHADPSGKTLVALGDSLTRGTGDASGKGYVGLVTDNLKENLSPQEIIVYNLGINGQTSSQLLQQLGQVNVGRQIGQADVILMTIGGNDLFQGGEALFNFNPENIKQQQQQYLTNLQQIFTTVRTHNPEATVFILGLFNPFIELEDSDVTNAVVREWNRGTEEVTAQFDKIVFVPTFDLFQLSVNDYLYSDHFHPNQEGYQLISDRLAPLISWEREVKEDE